MAEVSKRGNNRLDPSNKGRGYFEQPFEINKTNISILDRGWNGNLLTLNDNGLISFTPNISQSVLSSSYAFTATNLNGGNITNAISASIQYISSSNNIIVLSASITHFNQPQMTFNGSASFNNGEFTFNGDVLIPGTASIGQLNVSQTQLNTGSNILGTDSSNVQTLIGSVFFKSGSVTHQEGYSASFSNILIETSSNFYKTNLYITNTGSRISFINIPNGQNNQKYILADIGSSIVGNDLDNDLVFNLYHRNELGNIRFSTQDNTEAPLVSRLIINQNGNVTIAGGNFTVNNGYTTTLNGNVILGNEDGDTVTAYSGQLTTPTFISGFAGEGWRLKKDNNSYSLTVDNLTVRKTMRIYELLINQIRATNGSLFVSSAGKIISSSQVPGYPGQFFLFFETSSNFFAHGFKPNDLIRAQRLNLNSTILYTCDLIVNSLQTSASIVATTSSTTQTPPEAGMEFVRLGSTVDTNRQGTVYLTSDDDDAPFIDIVDGIKSHSEWNNASGNGGVKVRMGKLNGITSPTFGPLTASGNNSLYGFWASGSAYLEGGINATFGNIAGWGITTTFISKSLIELNSDTNFIRVGNISLNQINGNHTGSGIHLGTRFSNSQPVFFVGRKNSNTGQDAYITFDHTGSLQIHTIPLTIDNNGNARFSGSITSSAGLIAGWNILSSSFTKSAIELNSNNNFIRLGNSISSGIYLSGSGIGNFGSINIDGNNGGFIRSNNTTPISGTGFFLSGSGEVMIGNAVGSKIYFSESILLISSSNTTLKGDDIEISGSNFHLLDGNITASNATLSGTITANAGTIGGWDITPTAITKSSIEFNSDNNFIRLGTATGIEQGSGIYMDHSGSIYIGNASSSIVFEDNNLIISASQVLLSGSEVGITATNVNITSSGFEIEGSENNAFIRLGTATGIGQGSGIYMNHLGSILIGSASGYRISLDNGELILSSSNATLKGDDIEISGSNFHLIDGNITASNAILSGTITADEGAIGGWNITPTAITKSSIEFNSDNNFIRLGTATDIGQGSGIYLTGSGEVYIGNASSSIVFEDNNLIISASQVLLSGSEVGITATNVNITSSGFEIEGSENNAFIRLGTATGIEQGSGIYMDHLGSILIGSASGYRISLDDGELILSSSNTTLKGDDIEISGSNFHLLDGNITASNAILGGWRITDSQISSSGIILITSSAEDNNAAILMGNATNLNTGNGIFLNGTGYFRVGNPNGKRIRWDNDDLLISSSNFTLIDGNITASAGLIAGWIINNSKLYKNSASFTSGDVIDPASIKLGTVESVNNGDNKEGYFIQENGYFYAGTSSNYIKYYEDGLEIVTPNFILDTEGNILASNATLSGTITASKGLIGGFITDNNSIITTASYSVSTSPTTTFSSPYIALKSNGEITASNMLIRTPDTQYGDIYTILDTFNGFIEARNVGRQVVQDNNTYQLLSINAYTDGYIMQIPPRGLYSSRSNIAAASSVTSPSMVGNILYKLSLNSSKDGIDWHDLIYYPIQLLQGEKVLAVAFTMENILNNYTSNANIPRWARIKFQIASASLGENITNPIINNGSITGIASNWSNFEDLIENSPQSYWQISGSQSILNRVISPYYTSSIESSSAHKLALRGGVIPIPPKYQGSQILLKIQAQHFSSEACDMGTWIQNININTLSNYGGNIIKNVNRKITETSTLSIDPIQNPPIGAYPIANLQFLIPTISSGSFSTQLKFLKVETPDPYTITSYTIFLRTNSGGDVDNFSFNPNVNISSSDYTSSPIPFSNLSPNTSYQLQVNWTASYDNNSITNKEFYNGTITTSDTPIINLSSLGTNNSGVSASLEISSPGNSNTIKEYGFVGTEFSESAPQSPSFPITFSRFISPVASSQVNVRSYVKYDYSASINNIPMTYSNTIYNDLTVTLSSFAPIITLINSSSITNFTNNSSISITGSLSLNNNIFYSLNEIQLTLDTTPNFNSPNDFRQFAINYSNTPNIPNTLSFSGSISNLSPNTLYYIRAVAQYQYISSLIPSIIRYYSPTSSITTPNSSYTKFSGSLKYNNSPQTPMVSASLTLRDTNGNNIINGYTATASVDNNGNFIFQNPWGEAYLSTNTNYTLEISTSRPWGGVTATDALVINRSIVGAAPLVGLRLKAADVNGSNTTTSVDALLVARRTNGSISTFAAGNWTFCSGSFNTNSHQFAGNSIPIRMGSNNITYGEFQALCVGDVNGSYTPTTSPL